MCSESVPAVSLFTFDSGSSARLKLGVKLNKVRILEKPDYRQTFFPALESSPLEFVLAYNMYYFLNINYV